MTKTLKEDGGATNCNTSVTQVSNVAAGQKIDVFGQVNNISDWYDELLNLNDYEDKIK